MLYRSKDHAMTLKLCVMIRWENGNCACVDEVNISISSDLNIYIRL